MNAQKLMTMRILWGALFSSTVIYLVVVVVLRAQGAELAGTAAPPGLAPVFALLAVVIAAVSIALPRKISRDALLRLELKVSERAADERMFSEGKRRPRRFSDPAEARERAFPVLQTAFILGMALAESIAIFGFTLLLMGLSLTVALPFFAVCWVLMVGRFPVVKKLEQQLVEVFDADLEDG